MRSIICLIFGHKTIAVRAVGTYARPGGMLPSLDGYVAYEPHPEGARTACTRCRQVLEGDDR